MCLHKNINSLKTGDLTRYLAGVVVYWLQLKGRLFKTIYITLINHIKLLYRQDFKFCSHNFSAIIRTALFFYFPQHVGIYVAPQNITGTAYAYQGRKIYVQSTLTTPTGNAVYGNGIGSRMLKIIFVMFQSVKVFKLTILTNMTIYIDVDALQYSTHIQYTFLIRLRNQS